MRMFRKRIIAISQSNIGSKSSLLNQSLNDTNSNQTNITTTKSTDYISLLLNYANENHTDLWNKNQPKENKEMMEKRKEKTNSDNDHRQKYDTFFFSLRMSLLELKNVLFLLLHIVISRFLERIFFFFFANGLHWLFVCMCAMFKHEKERKRKRSDYVWVPSGLTEDDCQWFSSYRIVLVPYCKHMSKSLSRFFKQRKNTTAASLI